MHGTWVAATGVLPREAQEGRRYTCVVMCVVMCAFLHTRALFPSAIIFMFACIRTSVRLLLLGTFFSRTRTFLVFSRIIAITIFVSRTTTPPLHPLGRFEVTKIRGLAPDWQVRVTAPREGILAPAADQAVDAAAVDTHGVSMAGDWPHKHALQGVGGVTLHLTQHDIGAVAVAGVDCGYVVMHGCECLGTHAEEKENEFACVRAIRNICVRAIINEQGVCLCNNITWCPFPLNKYHDDSLFHTHTTAYQQHARLLSQTRLHAHPCL